MNSIRDSVDGSWKHLHLLTRQDLYNIQRAFKINCNERLHNDDYTSVLLWVEKMKMQGDNPVLFFKQQGMSDSATRLQRHTTDLLKDDDFMLVLMTKPQHELLQKLGSDRLCIDGTHGTTGYDFQLVTLLCVDEYRTAFPVAFCIPIRVDKQGMEALRTTMDATTEEMFKGTKEDFSDFSDDHGRDTDGLIRFRTYFMQNYFHRVEDYNDEEDV
ncbi:hypothetical protein HPB49_012472 [Dermacentor silvarum]|uniref:Uncharacterized protein n=1 Tax=Dermacentor silvarum TaxID=543639 RepID=A0ACB8CF25_DERSI|nr:hypothetical protein HPB49_012472 [Dermacentor silvarum]